MSLEEDDVQLLKSIYNNSTNTSDDELLAVDSDESTWSKKEFGDARLIFAVLPPPIIVTGVVVNVVLLALTIARHDGLYRHPVGVYIGGLCVCFTGLLVVDSGLQEWVSFITSGPITARAQWLCSGVPFAVGWARTSACWLTVCALLDRCFALAAALRTSTNDVVVDQPAASTSKRNEPSTSAGMASTSGPASRKTTGGGSAEAEMEGQAGLVRRRQLLCRPIAVMLLTASVFVAMAFANSPLLIRRWIPSKAHPTTCCCAVTHYMFRLCTVMFYGTTNTPVVAALLLFIVVLILLIVVAACRREVPDADDTKLVLVMSSPVAVCLFVVELLPILCRHKVIDDFCGIIQELSDLIFYAVIAVVPSVCFVIAPSLRDTCKRGTSSSVTNVQAADEADETIRLSTVGEKEAIDAQ